MGLSVKCNFNSFLVSVLLYARRMWVAGEYVHVFLMVAFSFLLIKVDRHLKFPFQD